MRLLRLSANESFRLPVCCLRRSCSQLVLAKKGPLGKIWLAAHMEKKVPKLQIIQTNIAESVDCIQNPTVPMALRVSGHLLLGVVRVFSRKVTYLLTDCSEALVKIKDAFKAPGGVELAPGAGTKHFEEITRQEHFEDEMDLDADLSSQAMLFAADEDDALAGIVIPDAAEELQDQLDAAGAGEGERRTRAAQCDDAPPPRAFELNTLAHTARPRGAPLHARPTLAHTRAAPSVSLSPCVSSRGVWRQRQL